MLKAIVNLRCPVPSQKKTFMRAPHIPPFQAEHEANPNIRSQYLAISYPYISLVSWYKDPHALFGYIISLIFVDEPPMVGWRACLTHNHHTVTRIFSSAARWVVARLSGEQQVSKKMTSVWLISPLHLLVKYHPSLPLSLSLPIAFSKCSAKLRANENNHYCDSFFGESFDFKGWVCSYHWFPFHLICFVAKILQLTGKNWRWFIVCDWFSTLIVILSLLTTSGFDWHSHQWLPVDKFKIHYIYIII